MNEQDVKRIAQEVVADSCDALAHDYLGGGMWDREAKRLRTEADRLSADKAGLSPPEPDKLEGVEYVRWGDQIY